MTGAPDIPPGDGSSRAGRELDDALYYLRHGCEPCAQRHFDLARRHGARDEQITAVRAMADLTGSTSRRGRS